ncbi:hypothetical protein ACHAWX_006820 [Stephanocyclus meneghinianus]
MQLLDSLPLPIAQFASLSVLVQLHHQDCSEDPNGRPVDVIDNGNSQEKEHPTLHRCHSLTSDKPKFVPLYQANTKVYYTYDGHTEQATVVSVHYDDLLEPFYTISVQGRERQTDNRHLSLNPPDDGEKHDEAKKLQAQNEADKSAGPYETANRRKLSHSVLRHDMIILSPFTMISQHVTQSALESLYGKIMMEKGMRDDFCGLGPRDNHDHEERMSEEIAEKAANMTSTQENSPTEDDAASSKKRGVHFRHDTKAGKEASHTATLEGWDGQQSANGNNGIGVLPMKVYRPPANHISCSLGFMLYYVQIDVDDISEENQNTIMLHRVMSVLLPDIPLSSLSSSFATDKQRGVILLTVAVTGTTYDLYGSSSIMANLPTRLQQGMSTLAAVDTTPKKEEVLLPDDQSHKQEDDGAKSKKGKTTKLVLPKATKSETPVQAFTPRKTTVVYDSAYFQRLYMALLATLMDDEDGYLKDPDYIVSSSHAEKKPSSTLQSLSSTTSNRLTLSRPKNIRFTFSRKDGNKSQSKYESGDEIAGGDIPRESQVDPKQSQGTSNSADIVRRTALQMEILSLAEDDMALPKYQHSGDGTDRKKPHQSKLPKVGGLGIAAITSARFGRKENQFDLAGFEYRPAPSGGSVSGTASTSIMGTSSDDGSTATGDETATLSSKYTMLSSQSSVPTLSKSKKDSASTSSRFKFLQKRKESKAASAAKLTPSAAQQKPPLFPQERQLPVQQQVFDPFGYDDDEIIDEGQEDNRTDSSEADSAASGSNNEIPTSSPHVLSTVSRSFSEDDSDGARSLPTSPRTPIEDEDVDTDVRVKSNEEKPSPTEDVQPPIPFFLIFQDHSGHLKSVQENKKFVEHVDVEGAAREYTYSITVPREEEYFPVVRYKCSSSLRPVPIRVQSRVRTQGKACRVALQISSNPQNSSDLIHLTIIMGVPKGVVRGDSLQCNPPGGTYNEAKSVVLWCVSELGGGEKFQLQAMFELEEKWLSPENEAELASKLEFPVLARCQCSDVQLSDIALEVADMSDLYPAVISKNVVRRFRVSHKEKG